MENAEKIAAAVASIGRGLNDLFCEYNAMYDSAEMNDEIAFLDGALEAIGRMRRVIKESGLHELVSGGASAGGGDG